MNKIIKIIALFAILTGKLHCEVNITPSKTWAYLPETIELVSDNSDYDKGDRFTLDLENGTIVYAVYVSSDTTELHIYDYDGNKQAEVILDVDWASGTPLYDDIGDGSICLTKTSNRGEFFVGMKAILDSDSSKQVIGAFFNSDGTQSRGQTTEMQIIEADTVFNGGYGDLDCAYSDGYIYIVGTAQKADNSYVGFYQSIDVSGDTSTAPTITELEGMILYDDGITELGIGATPDDSGAVAMICISDDYSWVAVKLENGSAGSEVTVDQNSVSYNSDDYPLQVFVQPVPGTTYVSTFYIDYNDYQKMFIITMDASDMSTVCHTNLQYTPGEEELYYIFYNVITPDEAILFAHDDSEQYVSKTFQANPSTCSLHIPFESFYEAHQITNYEQYGQHSVAVYKDDGTIVLWMSFYYSDDDSNLISSLVIGSWDADENCNSYQGSTCLSCSDGYEMTDSGMCSNGESDDADSKDSGSSLLSFSLLLLFALALMI